jgi:hypothetical protein
MDKIQYKGADAPLQAMSKAEFFALAEQRKAENAGSGFSEWGKHYTTGVATINKVSDGMFSVETAANTLWLGRNTRTPGTIGSSRTGMPLVQTNGVQSVLSNTNNSDSSLASVVLFPPAPNGLKSYDTSTGEVTTYADAATAFAAETSTRKVITSRQDFVFLEVFHEAITDKDVVYPLGNVQYGGASYEGISLQTSNVVQGYSAFGEWDATTKGYGVVWSTLSDANKTKFIQNPDNNIYADDGKLIQVRYRVRVVEGLGDDWRDTSTRKPYVYYGSTQKRLSPQGKKTVPSGLIDNNNFTTLYWGTSTLGKVSEAQGRFGGKGHYIAGSNLGTNFDDGIAQDARCFAVPIALVQRRNQGAYHPAYNPSGSKNCNQINNGSNGGTWYNGNTFKPTTTVECFNQVNAASDTSSTGAAMITGVISNGASGRPDAKPYDAIYASDVLDLRMSSRRLPLDELRETYKRKAIAGEVRGFDGVPFTKVVNGAATSTSVSTNAIQGDFTDSISVGDVVDLYDETSGLIIFTDEVVLTVSASVVTTQRLYSRVSGNNYYLISRRYGSHKQANPTWTDIIGSPANIAATFPDGVEGQWIPLLPDGTSKNYPLNRKSLDSSVSLEVTGNDGSTWVAGTAAITATTNTTDNRSTGANEVTLYHYETQAHFTQDDDNSQVLSLGSVWAGNHHNKLYGVGLVSSLVGEVSYGTGAYNTTRVALTKCGLSNINTLDTGNWASGSPEHIAIYLGTTSFAVKTIDYLSSEDDQAKLCYAYKEMVYDVSNDSVDDFQNVLESNTTWTAGTNYHVTDGSRKGGWRCITTNSFNLSSAELIEVDSKLYYKSSGTVYFERWNGNGWGDDNQFQITNNQSTITDDNGNTVLYGTASFNLPYFIDESN